MSNIMTENFKKMIFDIKKKRLRVKILNALIEERKKWKDNKKILWLKSGKNINYPTSHTVVFKLSKNRNTQQQSIKQQ